MTGEAATAATENPTAAELMGDIDALIAGRGTGEKAAVNGKAAETETVKGDGNEPESGEPESEEQGEAESESDDELEETEEGEDDEKPEAYTVKVDGQDVTVTLEELTAGYSREADYRRKTQAHADSVRQWEATRDQALQADRSAMAQEREQYKAVLDLWTQQYNQALGSQGDLDQLRAQNPGEWSARMTERMEWQTNLQRIAAEKSRLEADDKAKQETELKRKIADEAVKTLDAIPEWRNRKVYEADSAQIFEYANSIGYTPDEIKFAAAQDHRAARVLKDAAAYRALQAKRPEAQRKVEVAKPLPPGPAAPQQSKAGKLKKLTNIQATRGDRDSTIALLENLKF